MAMGADGTGCEDTGGIKGTTGCALGTGAALRCWGCGSCCLSCPGDWQCFSLIAHCLIF